ncbi:MAG: hypothetical protein RSB22_04595 [Acinetobacter sp.]
MLKFTDNQKIEHHFDLEKIVHVHARNSSPENITLTLHVLGPHTVPVTVEENTAKQILSEWENHCAR